MKIIVFVLFCLAIGLGGFLYWQYVTIASQGTQIAAIGADLAALKQRPKTASLDIQVQCSDQARKAFEQDGFKENDLATYQNHYNVQLNKCFIETDDTTLHGKAIWNNRNLYDAIEGKQYGAFAWRSDALKKNSEVPPVVCEVDSPQGQKQQCHSEEEYSKLVQFYMAQ
jgi:hypothetical protein